MMLLSSIRWLQEHNGIMKEIARLIGTDVRIIEKS